MRTRVGSHEVYHLWAHEAQSHAEGSARVSFEGLRAYSYGQLIGLILKSQSGDERLFIVNTGQYSVTTSKHQQWLRRALPAGAEVVYIDRLRSQCPRSIAEALAEQAAARFRAAASVRKSGKRDRLLAEAFQALRGARRVVALSGLESPELLQRLESLDQELGNTAEADANLNAWLRVEREKEAFKRAEFEAREAASFQEALAAWLGGERHQLPYRQHSYLRVRPNGSEVETSHGATVALAEAQRKAPAILHLLEQALKHGDSKHCNLKVGGYGPVSAHPEDLVVIGCHRFKGDEIRRFLGVLEALPKPESALVA